MKCSDENKNENVNGRNYKYTSLCVNRPWLDTLGKDREGGIILNVQIMEVMVNRLG